MKDYYQECDFCGKRHDKGNSSNDWFTVKSQNSQIYDDKDMCPECYAGLVKRGAKHGRTHYRRG